MTSAEFKALMDQYLAEYVAGGHYTSRWGGEEIDRAVAGGLQLGGAESKQEAIYNLGVKSNPNLLDNWYFLNPINQKGETSYSATGANVYFLDRWYFHANGGSYDVTTHTITFIPSTWVGIGQRVEFPEQFGGKTLTLSVFFDSSDVDTVLRLIYGAATSQEKYLVIPASPIGGCYSVTATLPDVNTSCTVQFMRDHESYGGTLSTATGTAKIVAMKLEESDHQTLARQDADGNWVLLDPPPDYGQELAKCQRYMYVPRYNSTNSYYRLPSVLAGADTWANAVYQLPVPMRTTPTASILSGSTIKIWKNVESYTNGHVVTDVTITRQSNNLLQVDFTSSNLTAGAMYLMQGTGPGLVFSANL